MPNIVCHGEDSAHGERGQRAVRPVGAAVCSSATMGSMVFGQAIAAQ